MFLFTLLHGQFVEIRQLYQNNYNYNITHVPEIYKTLHLMQFLHVEDLDPLKLGEGCRLDMFPVGSPVVRHVFL